MATVAMAAVPELTRRLVQIVGRPTLTQLQRTGPFTTSSRELVEATLTLKDQEWEKLQEEFNEVESNLTDRQAKLRMAYPTDFPVERETRLLLYASTRLLRPRHVLETGVADGVSTFFILAALQRTGRGQLDSVDIAPNVGILVEPSPQWRLHIWDVDAVFGRLAALFAREAPIDLFFHDSDHLFLPQLFEYETFLANAADRALLISDDVDVSYAFDTFCTRHEMKPKYLFDAGRKTIGVIRL
jgi:predicted O-methyltransferase YrrM